MEAVDGGVSSAAAREAARRAAEEAARRAAAEAARIAQEAAQRASAAQQAEEAGRLAARKRLTELNTRDGNDQSVDPSVFSRSTVAPTSATSTATTYSPAEAARLAALPTAPATPSPQVPASLLSQADQTALALLAHRMEERGAEPGEVQQALAQVRLVQIERDQRALAVVDGPASEAQGRSYEASAQASLDHYIANVDSLYSGLAPVDREQAGYLAYEQNASAKAMTYEALLIETQAAGLSLERATLERQLAVAEGASPAALAAFDARISDARRLLDGDPAVAVQVQDLEHRLDLMRKNAELYDPNRPTGWQTEFAKDEAALQSQIAALRLELPGNALLARLATAQDRHDIANQQLTAAKTELARAVAEYQSQLEAHLPAAQAGIEEFRTGLDLATSAPALDLALLDLKAILPTASPEELGATLDRIEALPDGDVILGRLQGADGLLAGDPRLRVLAGRAIGVPQGLERLGQEVVLNTLMAGIPSFLENQRVLNAPGAGPDLVAQARFGLGMDYVGFVLSIAGPVVEGVSAVARGGRTVVEIGPELRSALRTAGYADEAIDGIAQSLGSVATSSARLQDLLLGSTPREREGILELLGPHVTAEGYELRTLAGHPGQVNQLVARPGEIVDFLIGSDRTTVQTFWRLVDQAWPRATHEPC